MNGGELTAARETENRRSDKCQMARFPNALAYSAEVVDAAQQETVLCRLPTLRM